MKETFQKKINDLNQKIANQQTESNKKIFIKQQEIDTLKRENEQYYKRLQVYSRYIPKTF